MGKIAALLAVLVAGGAGWWLLVRGPDGAIPALALELDAQRTIGLAGVEDPVALLQATLAHLPREHRWADRAGREAALGFDPTTAEGWRSIGLDPAGGLGLAFDAPMLAAAPGPPSPIALVRLIDRAKLSAWIEARMGQAPVFGEKAGPSEVLSLADHRVLVGTRGGYTAFAVAGHEADPALRRAFDAFLTGQAEPLGDQRDFQTAFSDATGGARAYLFLSTDGLSDVLGASHPKVKATVDFYRQLFPGIALYGGPGGSGARLVASEKGVAILRQFFVPKRPPAKFSAFIPKTGWAALRLSVNLQELFDGLQAILPPTVPAQIKSQLGMARVMLPMATGFSWDDLTGALSGHFVVAASLADTLKGTPTWLLLIGLERPEKADHLIDLVLAQVKTMGATPQEVTVAGVKGHRISAKGVEAVLARIDNLLLVGTSAEVLDQAVATSRGENLSGQPAAKMLDGRIAWGTTVDPKPLIEMAVAAGALPKEAASRIAAGLGQGSVGWGVRVDRHGLSATGASELTLFDQASIVAAQAILE